MVASLVLANIFSKIGFCASFLANFFIIYLTVFFVENVVGTYKKMVIIFASLGIIFSIIEVLARPFAHNFNNYLMYFSFNFWMKSREIPEILIMVWAGLYATILAFITNQFVYRHSCLMATNLKKSFDGVGGVMLMMYPILPGALYSGSFYIFCLPDNAADSYVREEILINYGLVITEVPRFLALPYNPDNTVRWSSVYYFVGAVSIVSVHYAVIFYYGLKMHFNMKQQLLKFSSKNRKLQRQFFKALVFQSIGPTVFLIVPAVPVLLCPVIGSDFHLKFSWQTGWLYSLIGLYPPFDSISFMMIVTEYRKIIAGLRS
ncbi:Seven TM Receptor [Caenorhabditis elegans]|uniref:Seven TM Receptor n=1 Tax=Caenorhabditis elegans TaxID=6239 RepID=A0A3Q0PQY8_CAEEL|nr:Seven TM Receptor [Caenorhabditis elegans]CCD64370.2 Seven TM Receptor [Caenorhabditis elegans]|eukprot:NP_503660.2 Seven TM Receptor [Caenorhabditis elegans]